MNETRRNLLVGVFVLFGLAALGTLIVMFGRGPEAFMGTNRYTLQIRFERAAGISSGTVVNIGGIPVGAVTEVGFLDKKRFDQGVTVVVAIDRQYQLPTGTRAETIEPGLGMGRPPIEIIPGPYTGNWLSEGAQIPGVVRGAVERLLPPEIVRTFDKTATQIGEVSAALTPVLDDLHAILQPREPAEVDAGIQPGNLSSAAVRLDGALKHLNTVFGDAETQSNVKAFVENFHAISEDGKVAAADLRAMAADGRAAAAAAKAMMAKGTDTLQKLDANADRITRSTLDGLERATSILDRLLSVAEAIARGEGTLGKLARDDRLYESLVLTAQRLTQTAEEFRLLAKEWQKGKIRVAF